MITLSPSSWWLCISLSAQHLAWQFFSGQDFQAECGSPSSSHPWQTMRGRPRVGTRLAQGHQEDWQSRKDTTPWILAAHSTKKGFRGSFCLAGVSGLEAPCQDGAVRRVWRAFSPRPAAAGSPGCFCSPRSFLQDEGSTLCSSCPPISLCFWTPQILLEILALGYHYDYDFFFLFSDIASDFCFMYLCFFVVRCLMVYDVYLLCELHLSSLKILIFVSFKNK